MPGNVDDPGRGTPQDERLAEALGALANATRLMLLREVRAAKALREIELRAVGARDPAELRGAGLGAPRTLSRQAVRMHLERLVEAGVVVARDTERAYGSTVEYALNHQRLYALAEEVRELAKMRPAEEPAEPTLRGGPPAAQHPARGPCLVLVKGLHEGRAFGLAHAGPGPREWVIGRKRGLAVSLDFDPYTSAEHAAIVLEGGAYHVQDFPESRNGTLLNFQPLARGSRHGLRTGDVLGVGRSLLLFRG
jgi:DNA-binding transcriptional ArsR family regulator